MPKHARVQQLQNKALPQARPNNALHSLVGYAALEWC